ncbi:MAG TPA: class I SAM-dependent methyltransferase [Rhizomicrobium sp.]|nr:class I SAM-dependent methyltransferase [Rhizomicrobium sp.]
MSDKKPIDVFAYNRDSWNKRVAEGDIWSLAVSSEVIAAARRGDWSVVLTPTKPVPRAWFPDLKGCRVLALASAGGQQAPVLAAAGASVTVFDASPAQLAQDGMVAERDGLSLRIEEGNFADLSRFADASFDLVFHPSSNIFAPDVRPIWRECFRVLRSGGRLLAGFVNPVAFAINPARQTKDDLYLRYALPYSDVGSRTPEQLERQMANGRSLEWSHSLTDQIGGQTDAGFRIIGLYEDGSESDPLCVYMPNHVATLAEKP